VAELARILQDGQKCKILPGENQVEFMMEDTILISRLIEGAFPEYSQIIPKENKTKVTVKTQEFNAALKMASLFAKESANNIKLKINVPSKIEILATSAHIGDNTSELSGKVEGESMEVAFNAKFILDCLQAISSDEITLELASGLAAGLMRGKDANYLYVIMPLRVEE
jgi:DNA polymerase-3 subunit beta